MKIPKLAMQTIFSELDLKFEETYNNLLIQSTEENLPFLEYFTLLVETEFESQNDLPLWKKKTNDKRNRMKKRWLANVLDELDKPPASPQWILGEIELGKTIISKSNMDKYRAFVGIDTLLNIEDIIPIRTAEITEWATSLTSDIIDFPYLMEKTAPKIKAAFYNDLIYNILEIISRRFSNKFESFTIETPNIFTEFPLFSTSGNMMVLEKSKESELDGDVFSHDYSIGDNLFLRTYIQSIEDSDHVYYKKETVLDGDDNKIINYALSKRDNRFFSTGGMVRVDVGDLVRHIYNSVGTANYDNIVNRIVKISNYSYTRIVKKGDVEIKNVHFKIFSHEIEKDAVTGKSSALLLFSTELQREFIQQKTVSVYKNEIDCFKNEISLILIYSLQRDRIECHLNNMLNKDNSYTVFWNYDFLRNRVQFASKKLAVNLKIVKESLDEFIKHDIILESYTMINDGFSLTFKPLRKYEEQDLLHGSSNNMEYLV